MELRGLNKKGQTAAIVAIIIVVIIILIGVFIFINSGTKQTTKIQTSPVTNNPTNQTESTPSNTPSTSKTYNVDISNFKFVPLTLTINKGDQIVWTNKDSAAHTVTSDSGNELDSASLSNGASYSHTFETSGTYNYHCSFHTMMRATVIVQ